MEVYLSELAEKKFYLLLDHLQEEWGRKVRDNFVATFINKTLQISQNPKSCPKSFIKEGVLKCLSLPLQLRKIQLKINKDDVAYIIFI